MLKRRGVLIFLCGILGSWMIFTLSLQAEETEASVVNMLMSATEDTGIYEKPDAESGKLGEIKKGGQIMALTRTVNGWYQILSDGKTAYVKAEFFQEQRAPEELNKEVEELADALESLSDEEMKNLIEGGYIQEGPEYETYMQKQELAREKHQKTLTTIIISVLAVVVILSGIGYAVVRRKELLEEADD